ncbi:MAG: cobalamin-binding protein, partial [Deltaproteobacteria bacterium]
ERIVSMAPSLTETLFALGLGSRVVGVTSFCNYPPEAREKDKIGGFTNPNLEKIVSLKPDLVMATIDGNKAEVIEKLRELGLKVHVANPKNIEEILGAIIQIGQVTNQRKRASELAGSMRKRIDTVIKSVEGLGRPPVLFIYQEDPLIVSGPGTFANDLIRLARGRNISEDSRIPYPKYNIEEILIKKPERIFISSMEVTEKAPSKVLKRWKKWPGIPAIAKEQVFLINGDLIDRPGPRIVEGLELLARLIHPEIFNTDGNK